MAEFVPTAVSGPGVITLQRTGPPPFEEAFLSQTLQRCAADEPTLTVSPEQLADLQPSLPLPAVMIHCGRSGSTLLCRLLDATGLVATFREPDVLMDVHRRPGAFEGGRLDEAILGQLSWAASEAGMRALVKLPSHGTDVLAAIGPLLPTPSLVLMRDPVRVIDRVLTGPPLWLLHELDAVGTMPFPEGDGELRVTPGVVDHLCARWSEVVEVARCRDGSALMLSYDDLVESPAEVLGRSLVHLGFDRGAAVPDVSALVGRHAKSGESWDVASGSAPGVLDEAMVARIRERTADPVATAERLCGRALRR